MARFDPLLRGLLVGWVLWMQYAVFDCPNPACAPGAVARVLRTRLERVSPTEEACLALQLQDWMDSQRSAEHERTQPPHITTYECLPEGESSSAPRKGKP